MALDQLDVAMAWPWSPELFRVQREIVQPRLEGAVLGGESAEARDAARARAGPGDALMRPRRPADPYWMMAPTALLLAAFFFYPLVNAAYLSLYKWDLLTPPEYVGFDNYAALSQSGELWHAFTTTLSFSVVVVVGSMVLGLGMALALNRPGPFAAFVRGAVFSAYVVSLGQRGAAVPVGARRRRRRAVRHAARPGLAHQELARRSAGGPVHPGRRHHLEDRRLLHGAVRGGAAGHPRLAATKPPPSTAPAACSAS